MDKALPHVLVIGAGTMGCGIAAGFVAHGCDVMLLVRDGSRCETAQRQTLALLDSATTAPERGALTVHALDAFDGWDGVDLVIESIKEDLALKPQIFAWLDGRVPAGGPIGSNSSGVPISRIATGLAGRSRMFGMHYFMPAHRVPLVEVVLGVDSDPLLAQQVCGMFAATGKKPVLVSATSRGSSRTASSMP